LKDERYIVQLCRYIHYNPVKAGLVENLEDWKYSNYPEITGRRNGTLYSPELLMNYSEEFDNYDTSILMYQNYLKGSEFLDLLIEDE
jgi:putative transposase